MPKELKLNHGDLRSLQWQQKLKYGDLRTDQTQQESDKY